MPYPFPTGTEVSKFTEVEIVGLLEYSLPDPCRAKFDLDGYISTLNSNTRFIEAFEAMGRNKVFLETPKVKEDTSNSAKASSRSAKREKQISITSYHGSEHEHNPIYNIANFWTLKNCAKPTG
jgi:hypothetical protein